MPKDEFDFDDPMELNGVALFSEEDTMNAMSECFIEEFMRLGYNHKQVLALFRNPHYLGMNMILRNRGEQFVREAIRDTFARWGRPFQWARPATQAPPPATEPELKTASPPDQHVELDDHLRDPMGVPVPKVKL